MSTRAPTHSASSRPPSREAASRGTHQQVFTALRHHLAEGAVLDIPCGSGAFLHRLRDHGYHCIGGDLDPAILRPEYHSLVVDLNAPLPLSDATVDAVVSLEGIEHLRRPLDFVAECRRILKPGGCLILSTPNISSARSRWRWLLTGFHNKAKHPLDESRPALRHHISMQSYPEMRYALHTQGFEILDVETNRIKAASWLYAPLWPVQALAGWLAHRRAARGSSHARIITQVRQDLLRAPVFFGETLIYIARAV